MAVRLQSAQAARPATTRVEMARKVFQWLAWVAAAFWCIAAVSVISLASTPEGPYLDGEAVHHFALSGVAVLDAIGSILALGLAISFLVWRWPGGRPDPAEAYVDARREPSVGR